MARRSPLLLLLLLPPIALGALFWLGSGPPAPEDAPEYARGVPAPAAGGAELMAAAQGEEPQEAQVGSAAAARPGTIAQPAASGAGRVGLGTRIEGQIAYADGAIPGGEVVVLALSPTDARRWEREGRRIHAGLSSGAVVHGVADRDGRFALDWTGEQTELVVGALAPTAATARTVAWRADDGAPLSLTLAPRAALFVEVKVGPGFAESEAPNFRDAELELRPSDQSIGSELERVAAQGVVEASQLLGPVPATGWVDVEGRAAILAVPVGEERQLYYRGDQAATTMRPVDPLASGEQRSMTLELGAGSRAFGRLVDEAGAPVADAKVAAHTGGPFGMPGGEVASTTSDSDGRFAIGRIGRTAKHVVVNKVGYLVTRSSMPSDLAPGSQHDLGDLVLEQGAGLFGTVHMADGRPAAGAAITGSVDVMSLGQSGGMTAWRGFRTTAMANGEGRFRLSGLVPKARYDLVASLTTDGSRVLASRKGLREGEDELHLVLEPAPALLGRVLTPDGQPIPLARVRATGESAVTNPWMGGRAAVETTQTDEQGNFRIELDEAGTVSIEAQASGFAPSLALSVEAPSDVLVELHLRPAISLAGKVVDAQGEPVENATVSKASTYLERMRPGSNGGQHSTTSAADGRFVLTDLPAGEFVLHARHPEHTPSANVTVQLEEGQSAPEVVLTMRRGALVRGVVFEKGERAGAGLQIVANAMPEMETRMATTDGAGEFVLPRMPPGRWQIMSMGGLDMSGESEGGGMAAMLGSLKMQVLELEDGLEYQVEMGAPPADPVTVRGVVKRAGEALSSGMVSFVPQSGGYAGMKIASLDSAGRYEVVLPEPGKYLVTAGIGDMGGPGNAGSQVELRCDVPKATSFEYDIQLPGGAIRGRVRGPGGKPVVGTMVTWSREDGQALGTLMGGGYGSDMTDDQGQYELKLLSPGRYRIAAGGNSFGGMLDESPTTARGLRTGVQLGVDEVRENVDFELVTPGEVRGRVRDSGGKPVSGAAIFARDTTGAPIETMSFVQSDPSGSFRWRGLAPGDYTFHARGGERASAESARVRVRSGETAELELIVADGAYLIVRVEGAEAEDLARGLVRVDVRDGDDRQVGGLFSMEDFAKLLTGDRSFDEQRFGPLPPGSYRASATGPDGKRVERRVELSPGQERRLRLRLKD